MSKKDNYRLGMQDLKFQTDEEKRAFERWLGESRVPLTLLNEFCYKFNRRYFIINIQSYFRGVLSISFFVLFLLEMKRSIPRWHNNSVIHGGATNGCAR